MPIPANPKIYHIVHVDRLASIVAAGALLCDERIVREGAAGTTIGMNTIKRRRLEELVLNSHPGLRVGACVPFYFCPRSIMLYIIHKANHAELEYRGGQGPIIHLQADLRAVVDWADRNGVRWAFTLSNAGSFHFEDRANLADLDEVNWSAIEAHDWQAVAEGKQAEFLVADRFPFELVEKIGVLSPAVAQQVSHALLKDGHRPPVEIRREWYYR